MDVHVFVGSFLNRESACMYSEAQWEPEPDESVSDDDYRAWENRNPSWQMRADLKDPYLDGDFIETIDGADRYSYLAEMLTEQGAIDRIQAKASDDDNILVLIFSEALGGFAPKLASTPRLKYCGCFDCNL